MNCLNNCTLNSFIIKYSHKFNTTQTIIKDIIKSLKAEAACCVDCEYECAKDTLKEIIKSNHLYRIFKNILTCELELLLDYICGNINDVPTYDLQFFNGGNTTGCNNDRVSYSFILTNFSSESVPVGTTFNLQWTGLGANPVFSISTDQSFYSSATISNDGLTITIQEVINTFDMQNENIAVFLTVTFDNIGCGESEITLSLTSDNNYNITTEPATQTQTYIPQQMYSCSGNTCVEDENGQYDHPSCYGNCNQLPPTMYSCSGQQCIEDENGEYNNSNCEWACEIPQLLGFIEFDDIANSPVPGNSAEDWTIYVNQNATQWTANFTSTSIIDNKLEFFGIPQLNEKFYIGDYNGLTFTDYDFSGFTYMKELRFYRITGLGDFDFSIFPNLIKLQYICTQTINLDLSSCLDLRDVTLQYLNVTSLNISSNSNLVSFYVTESNLPALDFSYNLLLENIVFRSCTGVPTVNVKMNTLVTNLEGSGDFNSINVSNNVNLISLGIAAPNLLSLNIDNLTALESINIEGCALITTLNTSNQPNLAAARIGATNLLSFDPSHNPLLIQLWVNDTAITTIDISSNTMLQYLKLDNCLISSLTLVPSLTSLGIYNTPLTSIDISMCTNLENINGNASPLTNLDITNSNSWTQISLSGADISHDTDINAILAHLVSISFTGYLNLDAGTNAAPTGQGILDVATLISNGATIITN